MAIDSQGCPTNFNNLISFKRNGEGSSEAFRQGHNLHKLGLTTGASFTIPVFPLSC